MDRHVHQMNRLSGSAPIAVPRTKRVQGRADGDLWVKLLFSFGLVFLFPAFTVQLAFNLNTGQFTGSLFLKVVNLGCEALALIVILRSRPATDFVLQCRPVLVLVCMPLIWLPFSYFPQGTLQGANVLFTASLFGLAMVARFGSRECVRLVVRTMALGCALSYYWVLRYPLEGVHQAFELYQTQHAGLWRGVFSHKQGLGVFSGLTLGLLLFYGSIAFPSIILRMAATGCALRCLIGTKSTTGQLLAILAPLLLYTMYWIAGSSPQVRKVAVALLPSLGVGVLLGFVLGAFDWIPEMFGKSTDMTGRADIWPLVLGNFNQTSAALFGGGFGSGFSGTLSGFSVDNGYIDKLIEFGYIGSPIIFITFIVIFMSGASLILTTSREDAAINVFPVCMWFLILFTNISESNFMYKHLSTVLTAIIVGVITEASQKPFQIPATSRAGGGLQRHPTKQNGSVPIPKASEFSQQVPRRSDCP
jgi:exopolysaccharide production protein ExoQ